MANDRASTFLQMIRRSERGKLKIYLGYSAGVGKTFQMLQEGRRLKSEGIDVVVGLLETHGRKETAALAEGLEVVARRKEEYRGAAMEEMDLDAILARKPQVVLVDELAHTNLPGSRHPKRYEDVQDLLVAGIHVLSTLNVQHLESLYNTVEQSTGVKVRERVPDWVLADADQVVIVDLAAEDLVKRLKDGKIYPGDRVASALDNFFKTENLEQLRELTLRELASQLDLKRREENESVSSRTGQVMVCLSSNTRSHPVLLRYASRLAGRLNRNWYAVYVQTPLEDPTRIDAQTQRLLADTLTLANQLGAMVFTIKGVDVAGALMHFAREYRVDYMVVGRPEPRLWWQGLFKRGTVPERLLLEAYGIAVVAVDQPPAERAEEYMPTAPVELLAAVKNKESGPPPRMSDLLSPGNVRVYAEAIDKTVLIKDLASAAVFGTSFKPEPLAQAVLAREEEGSTFLNEGVALPHARVLGLDRSRVALGITRAGVRGASTELPVECVFLMLTSAHSPTSHLELLALAGRTLQNLQLKAMLAAASTPEEICAAIWKWEEKKG